MKLADQISGENFKLIGHVRNLVFYNNSSLERRASKTENSENLKSTNKIQKFEIFEKWSRIRLSRINLQVIDIDCTILCYNSFPNFDTLTRKSSVTSTLTANEKKNEEKLVKTMCKKSKWFHQAGTYLHIR